MALDSNPDLPQKLIGSFRVWYGQQDEVIQYFQMLVTFFKGRGLRETLSLRSIQNFSQK